MVGLLIDLDDAVRGRTTTNQVRSLAVDSTDLIREDRDTR
jgi:hypothetical protein